MTTAKILSEHFSSLKATQFKLFQDLEDSELLLLSECMELRRFSADQNLLKIGDDSNRIFFILSGVVTVEIPLVGGSAKERIASIGVGQTVGEFSLAREGKVTANVAALGEVLVLEAKCAQVRDLLSSNPRIGCVVYRNLSRISIDRLVDTNMLARNVLSQISLF